MNKKPNFKGMKKPGNMTLAEWDDYKANGLGPCQVLIGLDYCGQPAYSSFADMKEITIPSAKVVNYKSIGVNKFCPEHEREGIFINSNGTVTFGKSAYELEENADDGSNDL